MAGTYSVQLVHNTNSYFNWTVNVAPLSAWCAISNVTQLPVTAVAGQLHTVANSRFVDRYGNDVPGEGVDAVLLAAAQDGTYAHYSGQGQMVDTMPVLSSRVTRSGLYTLQSRVVAGQSARHPHIGTRPRATHSHQFVPLLSVLIRPPQATASRRRTTTAMR